LPDLLVFVDESNGVYGLIAVKEGYLRAVVKRLSWVKHYREVRKNKERYLKAFPHRFLKVKQILVYSRIYFRIGDLMRFLNAIKNEIEILVLDDKLYGKIIDKIDWAGLILESRNPAKYRRLMLLADNLANYARIQIFRHGKRKSIKKLKELEK